MKLALPISASLAVLSSAIASFVQVNVPLDQGTVIIDDSPTRNGIAFDGNQTSLYIGGLGVLSDFTATGGVNSVTNGVWSGGYNGTITPATNPNPNTVESQLTSPVRARSFGIFTVSNPDPVEYQLRSATVSFTLDDNRLISLGRTIRVNPIDSSNIAFINGTTTRYEFLTDPDGYLGTFGTAIPSLFNDLYEPTSAHYNSSGGVINTGTAEGSTIVIPLNSVFLNEVIALGMGTGTFGLGLGFTSDGPLAEVLAGVSISNLTLNLSWVLNGAGPTAAQQRQVRQATIVAAQRAQHQQAVAAARAAQQALLRSQQRN